MSDKPKKNKEKKKCTICRVFLWILALHLVVCAGTYLWVTATPRSLEQFLPQLEESIEAEIPGYDVQIGEAYLNWGGFGEFIDVKLGKASVNDLSGKKIAEIPELNIDFKLLRIIFGELKPKRLKLSDAKIFLAEQSIEVTDLALDFSDENIDFTSTLSHKGERLLVYGNGQTGDDDNVMTVKSDGLQLQKFAEISPYLRGANLQMDAEAKISFKNHEPQKAILQLSNISGEVENEEFLRDTLKLKNAALLAEYDISKKQLELKDFSSEFEDGMTLSATLSAKGEDDFELSTEVSNLQMANLKAYWPKGVSDNAVEWISESILEGQITEARANFAMRPWYLDPEGEGIAEDALSLDFKFDGLKLLYTEGLAPITNGSGSGNMSLSTLNVNVDSANIIDGKNSSDISNTTITISGIGVLPVETFVAKGSVEGSAANLISFYERAHRDDAIIRAKNVTKGTAKSTAELSFPLDRNLLLADINIILNSEITDLAAKKFAGKANVSAVNAKLDMDLKGYKLKGSANLDPQLKTDIIKSGLTRVDFDVSDKNNIEQYKIKADLTSSAINIEDLGIEKKSGSKARFEVVLRKKPKFADIQSFKFTSAPLSFHGDGSLKKDLSDFTALNFQSLNFKDTELSGKVARSDGGYKVYMKGDYFNAEPLLEEAEEVVADESAPPIYAELDFKKLGFAAGKSLQDVAVSVYCSKGSCDKIDLKSDLLSVNKSAESLEVTSTNFGDILKAFDVYEHLDGGVMRLKSDIVDGKHMGNINVKKFKVKESQFLLNLLTLGSLTGIADLLDGGGISFDKLVGNFEYEADEMLVLREARVKGDSIGATIEGKIGLADEKLDLDGKIIPAYSANTLLGEIPVLGDLLIGDDGVFAFAYQIDGTIDEPKQQVNPLSVLAPGVLQKIFE